jgi:hypothetical protein
VTPAQADWLSLSRRIRYYVTLERQAALAGDVETARQYGSLANEERLNVRRARNKLRALKKIVKVHASYVPIGEEPF